MLAGGPPLPVERAASVVGVNLLHKLAIVTVGHLAERLGLVGPPERQPPPPVIPPIGDVAESWVHALRWHHGPNERCDFMDCYPCWLVWVDAEGD